MTATGLHHRYERVAAGTLRSDTPLALSRTFVSADDSRRSSCRQLRRFSPVKANFEITRRHGRSFRSVHRLDNIRYPKAITVYKIDYSPRNTRFPTARISLKHKARPRRLPQNKQTLFQTHEVRRCLANVVATQ